MKAFTFSRSSRLGMAVLMLMSFQTKPVWAASTSSMDDNGILPIETSNVNKSLMDELFGPDANPNNGNKNGGNKNANKNKNNNKNNNNGDDDDSSDDGGNNNNQRKNNKGRQQQTMAAANVNSDFKCNLFESEDYSNIMSALNSLNSAVKSPACQGDSKVNVQAIIDSNKTVADAVNQLRGYVENPDTVKPENAADISNKVDNAIRAATSIANSFAQTDLLKKGCRDSMSAGQIATSINDVINGLTPYALMAATLTTGGAAAVPYIVGGSIITGAVSSMAKIIDENGIKVQDADVRRAIVENTCQYIRLDQKYKFLIKSRDEQLSRITTDLNASQRLFSAKIVGLSNDATGLVNRKNALDAATTEINTTIAAYSGQLDLDKQFMKSTTDDLKICQLGIQLAGMSKDKSSYVAQLLGTLDRAMVAYGTTSIAQAQALKSSAAFAIQNLEHAASAQFTANAKFKGCADSTRSFVETVDQSASLSQQLLKLGQNSIDAGLQSNKDYSLYKARLSAFNQKKYQAQRVTKSLDKLRSYANSMVQSEIDAEMAKLRTGLFGGSFMSGSPIKQWFDYVNGLHKGEVTRFQDGLNSLRARAYKMTASGKSIPVAPYYITMNKKQLDKDTSDAKNLVLFNLTQLPLGTAEHDNVCRELQDVWSHWATALDHLAASDAFCNMIEPYVYDNRSEDAPLVKMCRGYSANAVAAAMYNQSVPSTIADMKNALVKNYTRDWALVIKKRMTELACVDMNQDPSAQ